MKKNKIILAIETSCDETAASILEADFNHAWPKIKTLSSIIKSQSNIHKSFGGVVPEAAARAHVKYIRPIIEQAIKKSNIPLSDDRRQVVYDKIFNKIDYIAVTVGPGLQPSLIVGVEFAKALSFALKKPIIPVNHLAGHLYSPFKDKGLKIKDMFPMISLIVSGGHTILVLMKNIREYKVLGQTVDDAAGEAFDKVAKLLNLPYPGGPEVSKLADDGNPMAINFPRPMIHHKNYNFSFSGLKTAVLYHLRDLSPKPLALNAKADICSSFQQAVVDVLVAKTLRAAKEFKAKSISLSGGVAANQALRKELIVNCKSLNVKFMAPPINLCTDNAEMIGLAAGFMLNNGFKPKSYKTVKATPNLQL